MKPRKLHISPVLLLGLATLLAVGCLLAAVGITFARYRTEQKAGIHFQPDQAAAVYLGSMADEEFVFQQSSWTVEEDKMQLFFAISNGRTMDTYASEDQRARVRLIASLGAWQADSTETFTLWVNGREYAAVAERITPGSSLYAQFGHGWVFRFRDENGQEPLWTLPGDQFSCTQMRLEISAAAIGDTSLLQLQVIGEN